MTKCLPDRARRRWRRTVVAIGVLSGIGGAIAGAIGASVGHRQRPAHSHPDVAALVIGIVVAVAVIAVAILILWRFRSRWYQPPLAYGLPRRERRGVARAVRQARPSSDPRRLGVEVNLAHTRLRYARRSEWVFGVLMALGALETLSHHGAGRAFYVMDVAVFALAFSGQLWLNRRARRFLAAAQSDSSGFSKQSAT